MKAKANAQRQIRRSIKTVKDAAAVLRGSKRRFAPYKYLKTVYREYLACAAIAKRSTLSRLLAKGVDSTARRNRHAIRLFIDASEVDTDDRTKSRWTRALEYAEYEQVSPKALRKHFLVYKGISGSAREAARVLPRRQVSRNCWSDDYEEQDMPPIT